MKTLLIYPIIILTLTAACGSSKKTTPAAKAAETESADSPSADELKASEMTLAEQDAKKQDNHYRFIISFISIGEGTDEKAREMMDGVLNRWTENKGKPIEMETVPWGREGEVDFCFQLKELNEKDQAAFIEEMKTTFEGNSLVQMSENQPCMHKR